MNLPNRKAALAGTLTGVLLFLGAVSWGQAPGSIPPLYIQRLQIPVLGDDFAQPSAVVADVHTGEVFVCDRLRNRVVIFDQRGRFRYLIPGGTSFQSPIDLAVDPEGYLFVLGQVSLEITLLDFDGRLIRKIPLAGLPEDLASPRFSSLALSPNGESLFVLDSENDRLWIASRDGTITNSIDMTVGRPQEEIDLLRYGHIDVYGETLLVPIPTDGLVHLYDLDGNAKGTVGARGSAECQTMFPAAAALDDEGRMIILDQQRALFMTWDVGRDVCLSEHYGFGNAPGAFYQPSDLALDTTGRLYVSQGFEGRIQVYEGARPASVQLAAREPSLEASGGDGEAESAESEAGHQALEAEESVAARSEPVPETLPTEIVPPVEAAVSAAEVPSPKLGALLVAGARASVDRASRYDPTYAEIEYPGGDVPLDRGAAVDVVVRAFRHAGFDLQEAVHQDVLDAPGAYGINEPDPNIDHRRIRNLVTFFERTAMALPTGPEEDWAPGDLVFWDRNADGVAGHLGVVAAETGPSGKPLVVHHHRPQGEFSGTPSLDDVLFRWPVVGHYRWPSGIKGQAPSMEPAQLIASIEDSSETTDSGSEVGLDTLVAVEDTVRAWARAWSGRRTEEYLAFYSQAFKPGGGTSRSEWEAQRRTRISRPRSIRVSLAQLDPRLTDEDRAEVAFVQSYSSSLFSDKVDKILVLGREESGWKILAERVVRTYRE